MTAFIQNYRSKRMCIPQAYSTWFIHSFFYRTLNFLEDHNICGYCTRFYDHNLVAEGILIPSLPSCSQSSTIPTLNLQHTHTSTLCCMSVTGKVNITCPLKYVVYHNTYTLGLIWAQRLADSNGWLLLEIARLLCPTFILEALNNSRALPMQLHTQYWLMEMLHLD